MNGDNRKYFRFIVVMGVFAASLACGGGGSGGSGDESALQDPLPIDDTPAENDSAADSETPLVSLSSTIAYDAVTKSLWLTSPDDDQLINLNAETLSTEKQLTLVGAPQQLTLLDGKVIVTHSHSVSVIEKTDLSQVTINIPCGDPQGVVAAGADSNLRIYVACPFDERVVVVDPQVQQVKQVLQVAGRPSGLALRGEDLWVSGAESGELHLFDTQILQQLPTFGSADEQSSVPLTVDHEIFNVTLKSAHNATQYVALALIATTGQALGVYQQVDNQNRLLAPEQGGYGSVVDGEPRIEPRLYTPCGSRYAKFDGGARVYSGPKALAYDDDHEYLWIVNQYTQNVALLTCANAENDEYLQQIANVQIGAGARGIALNDTGDTAYIDVGFDYAVAKINLADTVSADSLSAASQTVRRTPVSNRFTEVAQQGRKLFFDATNTHITPSGVITCNTCHPDGREDGLNWFIHTDGIAAKERRTLPAWGARAGILPAHWDGEFGVAEDLVAGAIKELMGGDNLVIDDNAIAQYMAEIPLPSQRYLFAWEQATVDTGQAVFTANCASCHAGELYSDALLHNVTDATGDEDRDIELVDTPTLLGVAGRLRFLHDGRAANLEALFNTENTGMHKLPTSLSAEEIAAVIVFLKSI